MGECTQEEISHSVDIASSHLSEWYQATIIGANPFDGTYDVFFVDGESALHILPKCLRPFVPFKPGDPVDVRVAGSDDYLRGEIIAKYLDADGSDRFDVETKDGELKMVTKDRLRRFEHIVKPLQVGSRVMAQYRGGKDVFPGVIKILHNDGTADILYDDGDYESRLKLEFVEAL